MLTFRHQHPAVSGGVGGADNIRALRERDLGVVGECAPTHAGDHDGNFKFNWFFGETGADEGLG